MNVVHSRHVHLDPPTLIMLLSDSGVVFILTEKDILFVQMLHFVHVDTLLSNFQAMAREGLILIMKMKTRSQRK